jgi:hypothetical protein
MLSETTKQILFAEREVGIRRADNSRVVVMFPLVPGEMTSMKRVVISAFVLVVAASAQAATIVSLTGNSTGALSTGTASVTLTGNTLTGTLTNTSPFDARITGFGFDIGAGNLNGFMGADITSPGGVEFDFTDGDLGNVPQFNVVVLDFGYTTGPSGNFSGGSPNQGLATGATLAFMVTGPFGVLTEAQIADGMYVRFQRVGLNDDSDVAHGVPDGPGGTPTPFTAVPEPASMLLLGSGLTFLARRRIKARKT